MFWLNQFLSRATRPIGHRVRRSVGHAFTFSMRMAFIAPAKLIIAPAQLITTRIKKKDALLKSMIEAF